MKKIILMTILLLVPVVCSASLTPFRTIQTNLNINTSTSSRTITNVNTNTNSEIPTANVVAPPSNDIIAPNLNINANSNTNANSNIKANADTNINTNSGANLNVTSPNSNVTAPTLNINQNVTTPNPGAINGIVIINPNGGEEYKMNGQTISVYFKYFGLDPAKEGKLKFRVQLLQNGNVLGPVSGMYPFDLSIAKGGESLGYIPGWYVDLTQKKSVAVSAGDNYSLKVEILEGDLVIMSSVSNEFSFIANDEIPALSLKVTSPNGGEEFVKDAKVISGSYTYAGLDPNTLGGTYTTRFELWRNGQRLGNLYNTDFSENPNQTESGFNWTSGIYFDDAIKDNNLAASGGGYKIKITIFKNDKEIISDQSDGAFTYVDGPVYNGTPAAKILVPNGGEKYFLGKSTSLEFSFSGFDPYKGGKITYDTYLYKAGKKIGSLFPDWMHTVVNLWQDKETVYTVFDNYYSEGKKVPISPGNDYQLGIEISEGGKIILQDLSDANFTIAKEGLAANLLDGFFSRTTKVSAPVEIQSALYDLANQDKNIKSIKVNQNKVEVKYQQPAKLFGFIPVKYNLQINADSAKKEVTVRRPWWLFLTSNKVDDLVKSSQEMINSLATNQAAGQVGKFYENTKM
ncbi:MAG: hypothetical protein WC508_00875, partial [Patescibacteria group bacterium]